MFPISCSSKKKKNTVNNIWLQAHCCWGENNKVIQKSLHTSNKLIAPWDVFLGARSKKPCSHRFFPPPGGKKAVVTWQVPLRPRVAIHKRGLWKIKTMVRYAPRIPELPTEITVIFALQISLIICDLVTDYYFFVIVQYFFDHSGHK